MKKYLTVGTDEIRRNLFVPVSDVNAHSEVKPSGGLWLTDFDTNIPNYNNWVNHLLYSKMSVFFYKNRNSNPFKQPCCVVTLKEDANIFQLKSREGYQFLLDKFPNGKGGFSYERISEKYDGIYVDLTHFLYSMDIDEARKFYSFDVNTLILFNCDCIDHYYSGVVDIVPFDPTEVWAIEWFDYVIKWDGEKRYVDVDLKKSDSSIKR